MMRQTKNASTSEQANYPPVGTVLAGRYHLDSLISVGGMGAVFRATDSFLEQTVAIKVLLVNAYDTGNAEMAKVLANLRSEALASIRLTHPNIIRAYNYERDASWEFLVMEFVEGEDLRHYRKRLPRKVLPPEEVMRIGMAALAGLEHAHSLGIVHYDIKPANILLTSKREVKLCDFGLSVLTALGGERRTDNLVVGTPGYMCPEMIAKNKADHRADIYALAATLFDLCAGGPPFGQQSEQAFQGHLHKAVPDIAGLSRPLMEVIRRGLEKNPEIRFQSAAAMRKMLEAAASAPRAETVVAQASAAPKQAASGSRSTPAVAAPARPSSPRTPAQRPQAEGEGPQVVTTLYSLTRKSWSSPLPVALDSERTLVTVFGATELLDDPAPLLELARAFPHSHVIGCSTSGEISGSEVFDHSLSVSVMRFARTELASTTISVSDASQSFSAGEALARKLDRPGLRAVFVLSEGLKVNGSELVRGFNSLLHPSVVVTGGLAGDGTRFQRTWVLSRDKVQSGLVTAVGLYGEHLLVAHGSKGGWDAFGPQRKVTRSEGNVLYELDGKPALDLYKQYLGDKASGLPATGLLFPLALRQPGDEEKFLVRTLLAVDAAKNSMTFAGDIPKGSSVQLMKANFERLIGGASSAALMAKELLPTTAQQMPQALAFAISCVGRRLVLGERTEEEVEAMLDALPPGTKVAGFYSYGELSPYTTGTCDLHNQTMTLTVLSESPTPLVQRTSTQSAMAVTQPHQKPPAATIPAFPAPPLPVPASPRAPAAAPAAQAAPPPAEPSTSVSGPAAPPSGPVSSPSGRHAPGDTLVRVRPAATASNHSLREHRVGDINVALLQGRLTESFPGRPLGKRLSGTVLFELGGVERITSFGVRAWLEMVSEAAPTLGRLYLARCSEAVVSQLNMIRSFSGGGTVISFYAPYQCTSCKLPFERLIDCELDAASLQAGRAPGANCPLCQNEGTFDDEPASYFAFLAKQGDSRPLEKVPEEVRQALRAALAGEVQADSGDAVEKLVEGRTTTVRFRNRLDAVRWSSVFDGLEGEVVLDMAGVASTTSEVAQRFEHALRNLSEQSEVERIALRACPQALLERLVLAAPMRGTAIESAVLQGRCTQCATHRAALIDVAKERRTLREGKDPTVLCRRCNTALTFQDSRMLLSFLANPPGAEPSEPVSGPTTGSRVGVAVSPEAAKSVAVRSSLPRSPLLAGGVVALLAVGGLLVWGLRKEAPPPPAPVVAAPLPAPVAAPKVVLPPAWAERPFAVEGEELLVVGRGGPAASAEAAVEQARFDAVARLSEEMLGQLAGTPSYDFIRARMEHRDLQGALTRQRIAQRYLAQQGALATPVRAQVEVLPRDGGQVEAFVQYKLARSAFAAATDSYRATATFQGMTVARTFPLLEESPPSPELRVIAVEPSSPAELAGIREGDSVVSLQRRRVESVPLFEQVSREEWSRLGPGKVLEVTIDAQGSQRTLRLTVPRRHSFARPRSP
jgi:serine/threonine protein kinase